jgi:hypothetical protein
LLTASFRFHLTVNTLAVRLTIPPTGFVRDFHPQVDAPCRAHQIKARCLLSSGLLKFSTSSTPSVSVSIETTESIPITVAMETPPTVMIPDYPIATQISVSQYPLMVHTPDSL